MKNRILAFLLALLVVLTGMTLRRAVMGTGGGPTRIPIAIGTSPVPPFPPAR